MKNLLKHMVVGSAVVMTLAASETLSYAKEKGVSGTWTLSAEGYVLPLVLVQSGTNISGTLEGPQVHTALAGDLMSSTSGKLTWKAVRKVAR